MKKSTVILTIIEVVSGLLSAAALVGGLVVEAKEAKQIGCDENVDTKN